MAARLKTAWRLLKDTAKAWQAHRASRLGAALAFYTVFSLAPLFIIVLAIAGIYGVLSYVVAQRTREFGIRSALGSTSATTLALVTRDGLTLIGLGVAIGIIGGLAATRLLTAMLHGVSPLDRPTWLMATAGLVVVGLLATLIPAQRATRADPLLAIRSE